MRALGTQGPTRGAGGARVRGKRENTRTAPGTLPELTSNHFEPSATDCFPLAWSLPFSVFLPFQVGKPSISLPPHHIDLSLYEPMSVNGGAGPSREERLNMFRLSGCLPNNPPMPENPPRRECLASMHSAKPRLLRISHCQSETLGPSLVFGRQKPQERPGK